VSVLKLAGRPHACVRNQASGLKHLLPPAGAPATSSCTHYGNTCRNRRPKQRRRWPNIEAVSVANQRPWAQNNHRRRSFPNIVAAANADGHRRSNSAINTARRHMAFQSPSQTMPNNLESWAAQPWFSMFFYGVNKLKSRKRYIGNPSYREIYRDRPAGPRD
jgi:hypothetical protein